MMAHIVGISDCAVTNDPERSLITYALGSCIAIAIHDRIANVAGMLHFMLPDSSMNPSKAENNPYVFADTGIPRLFQRAYQSGADKRRLTVYMLGGAQVVTTSEDFNIGKRNHLAARKILWKAGVMVHGETVGGNIARTVRLENGTGKLFCRAPGEPEREIIASAKGVK